MASQESGWQTFKQGFIQGTGWALGATFGFGVILVLLSYLLNLVGGLPLIGQILATLVDLTQRSLEVKQSLGR